MSNRQAIKNKRRWVIKVGSALVTNDGAGLDVDFIKALAQQIIFLREQDVEVILVSSGAVAAGMAQLGINKRPEKVNQLQASAAVGQAILIRQYEQAFAAAEFKIAQVLLTHSDIANRERYLNARSTLSTLLDLKVLAVINENDTVATDEICFGDNDSLGALVANLVDADLLVILTDQDGLYSKDPRAHKDAELIKEAEADDEKLLAMASGGSVLGRGGMITKLTAAQKASRSGCSTVIANGRTNDVLKNIFTGKLLGTLLNAKSRLASKKQWLAGQMKICGAVTFDDGAKKVLQSSRKSLLPVGVRQVSGTFSRGELISCIDQAGVEIARGLSNYNHLEALKICGISSSDMADILGYRGEDELIHRDNMVLL